MILSEIYIESKKLLKSAGVKSFAFDTMKILEKCFKIDRHFLLTHNDYIFNESEIKLFFELINKRVKGVPLQYILGEWNFMGFNFDVGEGVLIPRDDTEVLVRESIKAVENKKALLILDLCGGSGAVSIVIGKKVPNSKIFSIEISKSARSFFNCNIKKNNVNNVTILAGDVLEQWKDDSSFFSQQNFDLIVSNPPYIPTKDLESLQKEVKFEPKLALDGGQDGLKFYRAICENWLITLKKNGKIFVEVGINQADYVSKIFNSYGLDCIKKFKDINGIERVVSASK